MAITSRKHPHLLELNAVIFLQRLSAKYKRSLALQEIPASEWKEIKAQGFDWVWLMGVWKRSPGARESALDPSLREEYLRALPDLKENDILGSPYAIYDYSLDPLLGAASSLSVLKKNLHEAGLQLMLDYVPNHLAFDHPWILEHPEYFLKGSQENSKKNPGLFFETQNHQILAHGKDPHFPAWQDTVQINFFSQAARERAAQTLLEISENADGVRCDMAMLGIHRNFEKIWGSFVQDSRPETEFWKEVIGKVRGQRPDFIFMAETYWDLEWELQQMGFDYTYDKKLYDRLLAGSVHDLRGHLDAEYAYQEHSVRFIENHDEKRAVEAFGLEKSKAAASVIATIPGLRFFQDGQREGKKIRLPVQLGREPFESENGKLKDFYQKLFQYANRETLHLGKWQQHKILPVSEKDNSHQNLLAWSWFYQKEFCLVVVNYSGELLRGRVLLPLEALKKEKLLFKDFFSGKSYERSGRELESHGLSIELGPWGVHGFEVKI